MSVFNADGSEASMCGNGLRLVARYVCEMLGFEEAIIETMKADLKVSKQADIYPNVTHLSSGNFTGFVSIGRFAIESERRQHC